MASVMSPKSKKPPLPHNHHSHPPLDAFPPVPPHTHTPASSTTTVTATATTTTVTNPAAATHSTPQKKKLTVDAQPPAVHTNGYHHSNGLVSPSQHSTAASKVSSSSSHSVIIPSPLFVRSTSSPLSSSVPSSSVPVLSNSTSTTASPLSSTPSSPIASASPTVRRFKPAPITPRSLASPPTHSTHSTHSSASPALPNPLRLPTPPKSPQLFSPTFQQSGVNAVDEIPPERIDVQLSRLKEIREKTKHPVVPPGEWEEGQSGVSGLSLREAGDSESEVGGGDKERERDRDGVDEMEVDEASVATTGSSTSTASTTSSSSSPFPSLSLSISTDLDDISSLPPTGTRGTYSQPSTPSHASLSSAADLDEFDPFLFIKHLPPLPSHFRSRPAVLPPKPHNTHKPVTLALDLDETLVHCSITPLANPSMTFPVTFNGVNYHVYVRLRPHLMTFLKGVSELFEVVIFTASQQVYADTLLNLLDPHRRYIDYRVFRDSCVCVDGNYLKDLHVLGRDLSRLCIVDNSIQAFGYQLDNGIPIESWYDDETDRELLDLLQFLRRVATLTDVRPFLRDYFNLTAFVASL